MPWHRGKTLRWFSPMTSWFGANCKISAVFIEGWALFGCIWCLCIHIPLYKQLKSKLSYTIQNYIKNVKTLSFIRRILGRFQGNETLVNEYEKSLAEITSLKGQILKLESTLLEAQIKSPMKNDMAPELEYWKKWVMFFNFTLYPAYSRIRKGNPVLKHSVHHFPTNFEILYIEIYRSLR